MIGDHDWAVFFGPAFAQPVTLTGPDGTEALIRGIFSDAHTIALADDFGGGVSTLLPVVTLPATTLPDWLEADRDTVTVGGNSYILRDIRPDGSGLSRLILERVYSNGTS